MNTTNYWCETFFSVCGIFQRVLDDHQYRFFVKNSSTFLSGPLHTVHSHFRNNLGRNILAQDLRKFRSGSSDRSNSLQGLPHLELPHSSYGTILMVIKQVGRQVSTNNNNSTRLVLNKYQAHLLFLRPPTKRPEKIKKIKFELVLAPKIQRQS